MKLKDYMVFLIIYRTGSRKELGRYFKENLVDTYVTRISASNCSLEGFHIVLDCVNGSATTVAKEIFE